MENIYHDYWEQELLYQFLKNDRCKKRAYICSPLSAVTDEEMVENIKIARAYMYYAMKKMGMNASAPHAYLPMLLCDKVPADRSISLQFGLELLEESDVLLICGNRISSGMSGEIAHAAYLKMPMMTFEESIYLEVQKNLTKQGYDKHSVHLDRENVLMGCSSPMAYLEKAGIF